MGCIPYKALKPAHVIVQCRGLRALTSKGMAPNIDPRSLARCRKRDSYVFYVVQIISIATSLVRDFEAILSFSLLYFKYLYSRFANDETRRETRWLIAQ